MSSRIEIELDDQGRLVLPIPLAQRLGLARGTTLVVDQETTDANSLRVERPTSTLVDKGGILVIRAVDDQPWTDILHEEREQRLDRLYGS